MQGATLNVSGVCIVHSVQLNEAGTWANVELYEPEALSESSSNNNKELTGLRASMRIPQGVTPPADGAMVDIRSAIINRQVREYQGKSTSFWTLTIFQWRELGANVTDNQPKNAQPVTAKPKVSRPVFDDTDDDAWGAGDPPF